MRTLLFGAGMLAGLVGRGQPKYYYYAFNARILRLDFYRCYYRIDDTDTIFVLDVKFINVAVQSWRVGLRD